MCTSIPQGNFCQTKETCGNGQKCEAGKCVHVAEGAPCASDAQCGLRMMCLANKCIALYGDGDLAAQLRAMLDELARLKVWRSHRNPIIRGALLLRWWRVAALAGGVAPSCIVAGVLRFC